MQNYKEEWQGMVLRYSGKRVLSLVVLDVSSDRFPDAKVEFGHVGTVVRVEPDCERPLHVVFAQAEKPDEGPLQFPFFLKPDEVALVKPAQSWNKGVLASAVSL